MRSVSVVVVRDNNLWNFIGRSGALTARGLAATPRHSAAVSLGLLQSTCIVSPHFTLLLAFASFCTC